MVPMVLLVSRPAVGCVCDDGKVMQVCCQIEPVLAALATPAESKSCCGTNPCPHCKHRSAPLASLKRERCQCEPIRNHIDTAKIVDARINLARDGFAAIFDLPSTADVATSRAAHADAGFECSRASLDRVVVFLHLTI
jgi:hypothetical protein